MENPTSFLFFLCISLVSVFVFALLFCEAQGQSNRLFFVSQSPIPPLLFVSFYGRRSMSFRKGRVSSLPHLNPKRFSSSNFWIGLG